MTMGQKQITGRKVLLMVVGFFAVVVGVNFYMAYAAIGTFPGLEVENSYVASQFFNRDRQIQIRLGWKASVSFDGRILTLAIVAPDGKPAKVKHLQATIGRATFDSADRDLVFAQGARPYKVPLNLALGKWEVRFVATAEDGSKFHQRLPIYIEQ